MILNHNRISVRDYSSGESLCPYCNGNLIAKKGNIMCWHWAHRANKNNDCPHEESMWHLSMKDAYLSFNGWEIEVPVVTKDGGKYRADAMNPVSGNIREFVHSLSPYYENKHICLKNSGFNVLWIFDGDKFVSKRAKGFLKPAALSLYNKIGGLVHYKGELLGQWKYNIFYPRKGKHIDEILYRYELARSKYEIKKTFTENSVNQIKDILLEPENNLSIMKTDSNKEVPMIQFS